MAFIIVKRCRLYISAVPGQIKMLYLTFFKKNWLKSLINNFSFLIDKGFSAHFKL